MITTELTVTEGSVTRPVRVRAANLEKALRIAGSERPGVAVEIAGPVAPLLDANASATTAPAPAPAIRGDRAA